MENIRIRNMREEELPVAVAWAVAEGWNPGLADAECFWREDPQGFYCSEADGRMVGSVSVLNYDDRFAFAGLYIVKPEYRGKGIGMQLYRHAMRHAGSRIVGGDGVIAMVPKYEQHGGLFYHYDNARYEGMGGGLMPESLTPVQKVDFPHLLAYDTAHFPAKRESFLQFWIGHRDHFGFARLDDTGKVLGYGIRRICHWGYKIGPLFAQDRKTAELILDGLIAGIPGKPFFLDVPVPNRAAVALAEDRQMVPVFRTARLYSTLKPVPLPLDEIFGITTFELG